MYVCMSVCLFVCLFQGLAEVALDCMCDLLVSLSYFNFRNNILAALVPLMPSGKLQGRVSESVIKISGGSRGGLKVPIETPF